MWFERFHDAACTEVGFDPSGNSSMNSSDPLYLEIGSQQVTVTAAAPPLDIEYVGVGFRIWNLDGTSSWPNRTTRSVTRSCIRTGIASMKSRYTGCLYTCSSFDEFGQVSSKAHGHVDREVKGFFCYFHFLEAHIGSH